MRAARAILATDALLHNLQVIKQHAPHARILAVVKANAYGHGIRSVSLRIEPYVSYLGVASIDEALALRKVGIEIPIVLLEGVNEPEEFVVAAAENFHVVFHDEQQIAWLSHVVLTRPLVAWLKIDTGLGRLGFHPHSVAAVYEILAAHPLLHQPLGIISHLACADTPEHSLNATQLALFRTLSSPYPGPKSICASAGIFSFSEHHYEAVRPGLALYGVNPFPHALSGAYGLRPVMTLQTQLIAVRTLTRGSTVGYGARYTCPQDMRMGVIAMGYGDGLSRSIRDGTPVLVKGKRCAIVGKISMDMATVDLRNCPDAQVGDAVVLWGQGLPLEEIAQTTGLSPYELLTGIQPRVKFNWV